MALEFDYTGIRFAVHEVTVEGTCLKFWAAVDTVLLDDAVQVEGLSEESLCAEDFSDNPDQNILCGCVFDSVTFLCQHLYDLHKVDGLRGKKVLELGAGMGIPGLWASYAGALVTMTDAHPGVVKLLERNVGLNGLDACVRILAWSLEPPSWVAAFDLVLASDVLYDVDQKGGADDSSPLFFASASMALSEGGFLIWAHKKRHAVALEDALMHAASCNLSLVSGSAKSEQGLTEVFHFVKQAMPS